MTAVLFDLFGVIARHQSPAARARLERTAGVSGDAFWESYWALRQPYDRGDRNGAQYWHTVADALGTHFDEERVAELTAADVASWSRVDDAMVEYVRGLADDGVTIGLLSNIPEELAAHYEEHQKWLKHFSVLAFSCRIGHAKPEADAYAWCGTAFGLPPEHILFVDDREANVRAAESLGMRGHVFTSLARLRSTPARTAV